MFLHSKLGSVFSTKMKIEFIVLYKSFKSMPYDSFCNAAVWHILRSNFSNSMAYKTVQNSIVAKSRLSHCAPCIMQILKGVAGSVKIKDFTG